MNSKLTYELTIAEKLEQVAVPDLSALIWSRIETELDADPGDIDQDGPSTPGSPSSGFIWGGAGLLVLIGTLFFVFNKPETSTTDPAERKFETPVISAPKDEPESKVPRQQKVIDQRPPMKNNTVPLIPADTASTHLQVAIDSSTTRIDPVLNGVPQAPQVVSDSVPLKKKRGVQGISPDDYKIVPKKDSQ